MLSFQLYLLIIKTTIEHHHFIPKFLYNQMHSYYIGSKLVFLRLGELWWWVAAIITLIQLYKNCSSFLILVISTDIGEMFCTNVTTIDMRGRRPVLHSCWKLWVVRVTSCMCFVVCCYSWKEDLCALPMWYNWLHGLLLTMDLVSKKPICETKVFCAISL